MVLISLTDYARLSLFQNFLFIFQVNSQLSLTFRGAGESPGVHVERNLHDDAEHSIANENPDRVVSCREPWASLWHPRANKDRRHRQDVRQ